MKKRFEINIDHEMLNKAKETFNACLNMAVTQAIKTGSMEGSATVKISFVIPRFLNQDTDEWEMKPDIKYKAGYSVPMKDSVDGNVIERGTIIQDNEGKYMLVNDQISMAELMAEDEDE